MPTKDDLEKELEAKQAYVAELEGKILEHEQTIADLQGSVTPAYQPSTNGDGPNLVHIATGQPYGQGLILFGLDDRGDAWQMIIGREPWKRLDGLPASH